MAIGNFGSKISFSVTSQRIVTFSNYSEQIGSRWVEHNIQGKMPRSEFLGADLMTVTMTVVLSAAHGINPFRCGAEQAGNAREPDQGSARCAVSV